MDLLTSQVSYNSTAPAARIIKHRNVTVAVTISANALFSEGGDVATWKRRFSQTVLARAAQYAPANKRPRWGHYGKPLKQSFRASTDAQPGRQKVHSAVGSVVPYSLYVDQGTGIYGGNGPYGAKVLPPWYERGFWFWEHTWTPPGADRPLGKAMVKGQRGQEFMDRALASAWRRMMYRSPQIPGEPLVARQALLSDYTKVLGFLGNTPDSPAFRFSLQQWRTERDEAFERDRPMRRSVDRVSGVAERRREERARRARERRAEQKVKGTQKPKAEPKVSDKPDAQDRGPTPQMKENAKAALTKRFQNQGFTVRKIVMRNDRTFVALLVPKGGGLERPVKGRW